MKKPVEPDLIKISLKSNFYNPFWYNKCIGREFIADVVNGEVDIEGAIFVLESVDSTLPKKVTVYVGRDITCMDYHSHKDYIDALNAYNDWVERCKVEQNRNARNKLRSEADLFNQKVNLPVPWCIGYKDVLSGLSEGSDGNGMNKATVYHVTLMDKLNLGKLKRNANDFLCTAPTGNNGKDWSVSREKAVYHCDGDGYRYTPKPTCKKCLKLLERFINDR